MNVALHEAEIIEPGAMTTVQDLGRAGHAASGVARSGAADAVSLRIGNRLVGNPEGAAALEMTMTGSAIRFGGAALVCLTGASALAAVVTAGGGSRPIAMWRPMPVGPGETVRIGPIGGACIGVRTYLCIAGGVMTDCVLGSRSTHVSAGLGWPGRALRSGDRIPVAGPVPGLRVGPLSASERQEAEGVLTRRVLRVTTGAHAAVFPPGTLEALIAGEFRVDARSDRVGVRLVGSAPLPAPAGVELPTEGAVTGSVQVPPSGQPIVLGVDGPVTGGYPVLACVVAADLAALGQSRPGDPIRFELVSREAAVDALQKDEAMIVRLGAAAGEPR